MGDNEAAVAARVECAGVGGLLFRGGVEEDDAVPLTCGVPLPPVGLPVGESVGEGVELMLPKTLMSTGEGLRVVVGVLCVELAVVDVGDIAV